MCNGVASKFDDPEALYTILRVLMGEEFKITNLETFMCNSVASKFDNPTALYTILRAFYSESTESDAQVTADEVTSLMNHISSRLTMNTVTNIRQIKKLAIANGRTKWMGLIRRPYPPHLGVVLNCIEKTKPENRKSYLETLTNGSYQDKQSRIRASYPEAF